MRGRPAQGRVAPEDVFVQVRDAKEVCHGFNDFAQVCRFFAPLHIGCHGLTVPRAPVQSQNKGVRIDAWRGFAGAPLSICSRKPSFANPDCSGAGCADLCHDGPQGSGHGNPKVGQSRPHQPTEHADGRNLVGQHDSPDMQGQAPYGTGCLASHPTVIMSTNIR